MEHHDYLIIGTGIIGLTIAMKIKEKNPKASILMIEKESEEACHSSGRNSGVLHAGFYYSADSFKAKFTVAGNNALKAYCKKKHLPINACGKLIVAMDEREIETLYELEKRGKNNGSTVEIVDEARAREIEPNVFTHKKALFSPDTASIDPKQVCTSIRHDVEKLGVQISFNTKYLSRKGQVIVTNKGDFTAGKIINCGGLYADKIAQDFGFGFKYTMIPFKGLYLQYTKNKTDVKINIYPVPNLLNPFLGVHYTIAVDQTIKIGPTAIPAFWRENYKLTSNFKFNEFLNVAFYESRLFFSNAFGFRNLAFEEMKKYYRKYFVGLAQKMVQSIDPAGFTVFSEPGIRAQLLDKTTLNLVQDFVVEGDDKSIHVLNAVSPAYTCAFPFAEFLIKEYIDK